MKTKIIFLLIIIMIPAALLYSQIAAEKTANVYIIDSYVTEKIPYKFHLYFFTDDSVKSSVIIDNKYNYDISKAFAVDHKIEIAISQLQFDSLTIPFQIILQYPNGKKKSSEIYELELPYNSSKIIASTPGLFKMCIGGILFLLPSPGIVFRSGERDLSLSLELPIISFYSNGFNYPSGYVGVEYSHIFGSDEENYLNIGYKKIFETNFIEFVSSGMDLFTNFNGSNGIKPEVTFGLFKVAGIFTFYSRYSYNLSFAGSKSSFHEISFGLYAHFFSLNL